MGHVFISYSKSDNGYASRLVEKLRQEGFDVWIDNRSLHNSEDWWRSIVLAIWQAQAVVVLLTSRSDDSKWVQREITIADKRNKPMFPLLLEGDLETVNWSLFVRTQYNDVRDGSLPPDEFYIELAKHANRNPDGGRNVTATAEHQAVRIQQTDPDFLNAVMNMPGPDTDLAVPSVTKTVSKTVQVNRPRQGIPALLVGFIVAGILLVAAVSLIVQFNSPSTPTAPAPVDATDTPRPIITFTPVSNVVPTLDPATTPATLDSINAWRFGMGLPPLSLNAKLERVASVHLNYLASLPLETIREDLPFMSADGLPAQGMAQAAGYAGNVQMFIYPPAERPPTLADLMAMFAEFDPAEQMQRAAQDAGLVEQVSEDTGLHYLVLLLGEGESD
jgi:hypothetical protein